MSEPRQLPLFPTLPASEADLHPSSKLADTIVLFQAHLIRSGKTAHTVEAFTSDLELLMEYCGGRRAIGALGSSDLNGFLHWLEFERGVPCSRKSYARRVTTLKVYFKWLYELKAIPHDPAAPLLQRSGPAPLADVLEESEVMALLAAASSARRGDRPDARPEVLVRLLLETGIKKGETSRLQVGDIERPRVASEPATIRVRHSARTIYKERLIPVSETWLRVFDEYAAAYALQSAVFACTARNLEYILEDLGESAGVGRKVSFEMLRWTCALRDYRAGMAPDAIREKLGLSRVSWVETFSKIRQLAGETEPKANLESQ